MSMLNTPYRGGVDALRDHDPIAILPSRLVRYGVTITGYDEFLQPKLGARSLSDVNCAHWWDASDRPLAGWAFAWPVVAGSPGAKTAPRGETTPGDTLPPPVTTPGDPVAASVPSRAAAGSGGSGVYTAPGGAHNIGGAVTTPGTSQAKRAVSVLPIDDRTYAEDKAFARRSVALASGWPGIPKGTIGLVTAGSRARSQEDVFLHCDPRLMAVNRGADPDLGSIVADEGGDGGYDPERSGRLQGFWRVTKQIESTFLPSGRGSSIAWQLMQSEKDDLTGFGLVCAMGLSSRKKTPETPKPKTPVTTPGDGAGIASKGAGGSAIVGAGNFGGGTFTYPGGAVPPGLRTPADAADDSGKESAFTLACMGSMASGPLDVGHGDQDHHRIGASGDHQVNAGHLSTDALFFKDETFDAPLHFQYRPYPHPPAYPLIARTHLVLNFQASHQWKGGTAAGLYDWYTEVPFVTNPPPRPPPPTTPPRQPPPTTPPPSSPPTTPPTAPPTTTPTQPPTSAPGSDPIPVPPTTTPSDPSTGTPSEKGAGGGPGVVVLPNGGGSYVPGDPASDPYLGGTPAGAPPYGSRPGMPGYRGEKKDGGSAGGSTSAGSSSKGGGGGASGGGIPRGLPGNAPDSHPVGDPNDPLSPQNPPPPGWDWSWDPIKKQWVLIYIGNWLRGLKAKPGLHPPEHGGFSAASSWVDDGGRMINPTRQVGPVRARNFSEAVTDSFTSFPGSVGLNVTLFRPQRMLGNADDLRSANLPTMEQVLEAERNRPVVLRAEPFGAESAEGFSLQSGKQRVYPGTAVGGILYMPPQLDLFDTTRAASALPTTTEAFVATFPGVSWGAGVPIRSSGKIGTGYTWSVDAAGVLTFSRRDSAGAATPALVLDAAGGVTLGGKVALSGVLSPAQITSNQNNYSPTGLSGAGILRINSDAPRSVTGLAGGTDDRMLVVENPGAFPITLPNQSASSDAANRFLFGADLVLAPEDAVLITYDNASARWRSVGRSAGSDARLLTTVEPSNAQRVLVPDLSPSTPFLLVATDCYFVYVGRAAVAFVPQFVEFLVTVAGVGIQTAEVGLFSSPGPPDKTSKTTLTKIEATGTVDSLTTTGVKRNTSAFSTSVPAGTHLWAAIRTNLTVSQPTLLGIANDLDQGQIQLDNAAAALTSGATKNGTLIGSALAVGANCPYLTVTLD